uniref:Uncharacterized protein n=1 Tax=Arundo donax TaxID=35708 RepID=A0A0A9C503_ARUDO
MSGDCCAVATATAIKQ